MVELITTPIELLYVVMNNFNFYNIWYSEPELKQLLHTIVLVFFTSVFITISQSPMSIKRKFLVSIVSSFMVWCFLTFNGYVMVASLLISVVGIFCLLIASAFKSPKKVVIEYKQSKLND